MQNENINLNKLSIRELESIVGRPADDVRVRNGSAVCLFRSDAGSESGSITRVHIAKK